jgi:hypothetical protein
MVSANKLASILSALCFVLVLMLMTHTAGAQDKTKDPNEGKKGKTIGTLTEKSENFIEVKADGEEKARRYVPHWIGGAPAQGGGFDKKVLKTFKELRIGSRVEVQWEFEERFRVLTVKVLALPKDKNAK